MFLGNKNLLQVLVGMFAVVACMNAAYGGPPANGFLHGLARVASVDGDWSGLPSQDDPEFGYSVAMDGNWLAVGAPQAITDRGTYGVARHGAVFLFHRENGIWVRKIRLLLGQYGDSQCGYSVAMDLPRLVIGCPGDDNANPSTEAGTVYWYRLFANQWDYDTGWNEVSGGHCGADVDILVDDGDRATIAYGCPYWNSEQGLVKIWQHDPDNGWVQQAPLSASDAATGDRFGGSVSLSEINGTVFDTGVLAVGAPTKSFLPAFAGGKVYVFHEGFGSWIEADSMTHFNPSGYNLTLYGEDVAIRGKGLLIGSPGGFTSNCSASPRCGRVEKFTEASGDWNYIIRAGVFLTNNDGGNPPGPQLGMKFGQSVAFGFNGMVAVGAPRTDGFTWNGGLAEEVGLVEIRDAINPGTSLGEVRPTLGFLSYSSGHFGSSVDFGDEYLAVGYPGSGFITTGGVHRFGSVYIYGIDQIFADGFDLE